MGSVRMASQETESSSNGIAREITIKPLNYGFVVTVGCHSFAIETKEKLVEKLRQYYDNPAKTEQWHQTKSL